MRENYMEKPLENRRDVRPARASDIDAVCAIYTASKAFMHENGNPHQWPGDDASYPGRKEARLGIRRGTLFVCEDDRGEIVGCFDFEAGPEPDYRLIDGAWLNTFPYFVIHRMATLKQGEGVGSAMLEWIIRAANNIRADTHADNKAMQALLESHGFIRCGTVKLRHVGERIAYHFQRPDDRHIDDKPFWAFMR
jgi:RimJ/RimL family protein N-acetyltransferase